MEVGDGVVAVFGCPFYDAETELVWSVFGGWREAEFLFWNEFVFFGLGFVLVLDGAAFFGLVGEEAD